MRKPELIRHVFPVVILSTLCAQLSTAAAQSLLTPAGAPAPTTKSFEPAEPRTPIDAAHTPGDGLNQFIISAPGSYYLPGNLTGVSGKNGLSINADNVTVDLDGFALVGVAGGGNGIIVPTTHRNLRLFNGSVDFWYGNGIECSGASNSEFEHLRVSQDNGFGLDCGDGSVLDGCSAEANGVQGLRTGDRSTLTGCTSANNGQDGIATGRFCTLTNCSSSGNFSPAAGFQIDSDCTITACSARNDYYGFQIGSGCSIKDCTANWNTKHGIESITATQVVNCTACYNGGDGIACSSDCLISGNTASFNVNGIESFGLLNRIDGNTANHNSHAGILWANDVVIRNSAFLNTFANYSPPVGTGNTGPLNAAGTSTSPWANF